MGLEPDGRARRRESFPHPWLSNLVRTAPTRKPAAALGCTERSRDTKICLAELAAGIWYLRREDG